jgi:hypothetical protein
MRFRRLIASSVTIIGVLVLSVGLVICVGSSHNLADKALDIWRGVPLRRGYSGTIAVWYTGLVFSCGGAVLLWIGIDGHRALRAKAVSSSCDSGSLPDLPERIARRCVRTLAKVIVLVWAYIASYGCADWLLGRGTIDIPSRKVLNDTVFLPLSAYEAIGLPASGVLAQFRAWCYEQGHGRPVRGSAVNR